MIRLILFLLSCFLWDLTTRSIITPVATLARQSAAVAAVGNSNAAYVAQQAVESGGASTSWLFYLGVFLLFIAFFQGPIRRALGAGTSS